MVEEAEAAEAATAVQDTEIHAEVVTLTLVTLEVATAEAIIKRTEEVGEINATQTMITESLVQVASAVMIAGRNSNLEMTAGRNLEMITGK